MVLRRTEPLHALLTPALIKKNMSQFKSHLQNVCRLIALYSTGFQRPDYFCLYP